MGNLKYFRGSLIVTILGLILAFFIGGTTGLFLVCVLAILEISLSFDNTVVNATVLKDMSELWRKRFVTWGVLVAVFGMRIIFPILIVSIVAKINPISAVKMSMYDQASYTAYMAKAHVSLMAFGGAFLLMVGLSFFIDEEKDVHWLVPVEKTFLALSKVKFITAIVTIILFCIIGFTEIHKARMTFILSAIAGLVVFLLIEKLAEFMESKEEARGEEAKASKNTKNVATTVAKGGFAMFVYLEILDSSFSFDGVIGAFAITTNLFIIAIGLAIGALFVRSMTIMLVELNTLSEYRYLEHGAFYAIVSLAIIMFLKTFTEIPEIITGSIGALFIVMSFIHSLAHKKRESKQSE